MGQSSSINSKSVLPNNILIDASDSYITDVKLKSTAIVPISEYIKRDKYSKNGQLRYQKIKKNTNIQEMQKEDKLKVKNVNKNRIESNEKKNFIDSSLEEFIDRRKWVKTFKYEKEPLPTPKNPIPDKTNANQRNYTSAGNVHELYKNEVYPHIYKTKYQKNNEIKPAEKKIRVSAEDCDENPNKKEIKNQSRKQEMSTHTLNKHHLELNNPINRKLKQSSFTIQTNIACVIHPEKKLYGYRIYSGENIRKPHKQKHSVIHKTDYRPMIYDKFPRTDNERIVQLQKKEEHKRKSLSARQALENWKHIHTLKQYQKQFKLDYHKDQFTMTTSRSSADYSVLKTEIDPDKMTPLEISNYNYARITRNHSSLYALNNKVGEHLRKHKHNIRAEKPHSHQYEYNDNSLNKHKPHVSKNHHRRAYYSPQIDENREEAVLEREDFLADIERCLKNHHKRATIYGRQYSASKATWVQDKHSRWHKIVID